MGSLSQLKKLFLCSNQLTSLPVTMGDLQNLDTLNICNNKDLRELPLSLGQIPGLTHIFSQSSGIRVQETRQILDSCKLARKSKSSTKLPAKMDLWQSVTNNNRAVDLQTLSDSEKGQLYEWLTRLERATDFSKCQKKLAATVWNMMLSLTDPEYNVFKESFFNQLSVNLVNCQDRAAMTLNILYTSWKLECSDQRGDIKRTLEALSGLARTVALRDELAKQISQAAQSGVSTDESVEIYLYYETTLKDSLKLETAIDHMAYEAMGKRNWIDNKQLTTTVNKRYLSVMASFPKVEALWNADAKAQEQYNRLQEKIRSELEVLGKQKGDLSSQDYATKAGALGEQFNQAKLNSIIKWIEKNAKSESIFNWIKKKL